jgi:hypothetical protein
MNRRISNLLNYGSKGGPTKLQKFQINYGLKKFEINNNFSYINFFRLEMEFELKFREVYMS